MGPNPTWLLSLEEKEINHRPVEGKWCEDRGRRESRRETSIETNSADSLSLDAHLQTVRSKDLLLKAQSLWYLSHQLKWLIHCLCKRDSGSYWVVPRVKVLGIELLGSEDVHFHFIFGWIIASGVDVWIYASVRGLHFFSFTPGWGWAFFVILVIPGDCVRAY